MQVIGTTINMPKARENGLQAFDSIKKLRVKVNTKGINHKELIMDGRRY